MARYLSIQFKLGWKKHGGILKRPLKIVLLEAGIGPTEKVRARDVRRVHDELNYLVELGVLKSWRPVDNTKKTADATYEFIISDSHPLKEHMNKKENK